MYARPVPPPKRRTFRTKKLAFGLCLLVITAAYCAIIISRPFAQLAPSIRHDTLSITTPGSDLPWPAYGQGAFGLTDGTIIATHGDQEPLAMASAAKIVTALVTLDKHPLRPGQDGPTLTMGASDVALYNSYVAKQGSVTPVAVGQKLTERDMLEALLLPSANNIADSLAVWSFGSVDGYITYANAYAAKHGLQSTHLGSDASGFAPENTSTAADLVKIGALALKNAALAEIVAQKTASIPGVGTVRNVNTLLGTNSIVGIKTGNNDQNGGVFVGARTQVVNGKSVTIVSALSGAATLAQALRDSSTLLAAISTTFAQTSIVRAGDVIGTYHDSQHHALQAVASRNLDLMVLRGSSVRGEVTLQPIKYTAKVGDTVGTITINASSFAPAAAVPVTLKQAPAAPSILFRLTHP